MNTFALATLTLSTLCLGGAFAAIVTARHVRLRRDAEDRRALGHVLEEVDRRLATLAAAEESGATAQIVGRLIRLDERLGSLADEVAQSADRAARSVSTASERSSAAAVDEDLTGDPPEDVEADAPPATVARPATERVPASDEADDPELAALLAKFEDDSFSFADAARSKDKEPARRPRAAPQERTADSEVLDRSAHGAESPTPVPAATGSSPIGARDPRESENDEDASSGANASDQHLDPVDSNGLTGASDEARDQDELLEAAASGVDEPSVDLSAEETRTEIGPADDAPSDDVEDALALDELVLFFHEDDQGDVLEASAEDVALFDDEQAAPAVPLASAALAPASEPLPSEPRQPNTFRESIDELSSLTERLSRPIQDRSERLRLVGELSAALARLRR